MLDLAQAGRFNTDALRYRAEAEPRVRLGAYLARSPYVVSEPGNVECV